MIKRFYILLWVFCALPGIVSAQGVLIGDTAQAPDPNAILELRSGDKGLLIPRISRAQRNAMVAPAPGMQIYNNTDHCLEMYFPFTGWRQIMCDCTVPPADPVSISGPSGVCAYTDSVLYVVQPVPGATSYQWSTSYGTATIYPNSMGDSVYITFSNQYEDIYVMATNFCGSSNNYSIYVDVSEPDAQFNYSANAGVNYPASFSAVNGGYASYQWTFQGGNPVSSNNQNASTTWNQTGTYQVMLVVTDNYGCIDTEIVSVNVVNCPPLGSSQTTFYASGSGYSGNLQYWTVPGGICNIRIAAWGGQGGSSSSSPGGPGAYVVGEFQVVPGQQFKILVGHQGGSLSGSGSGGGGGSFVTDMGNNPYIIAGGGGGGGESSNPGQPGSASTQATNAGGSGGSTNGQGGPSGNDAAGGGGLLTNGSAYSNANAGQAFINGGFGGQNIGSYPQTQGGYGGGGAGSGSADNGAGGGGGYAGGGGGNSSQPTQGGGGGSSYNGGTNQINQSGIQYGNGQVIITW